MTQRTVLITGGNTGLGLASAGQIARTGARVIITSRDPERGKRARQILQMKYGASVDVLPLDLASFDSIRECADTVLTQYPALDVLVNNAGLILSTRQETQQGFEATLGVNHIGPAFLTKLLLDRLMQSDDPRVVNLASAAHRSAITGLPWRDMQNTRRYTPLAYSQSKLCNILYTHALAARYAEQGLFTCSVHPGVVASDFARDGDTRGLLAWSYALGSFWMKTPERAAKTTVWAATDPLARRHHGAYLVNCKPRRTTAFARNSENAERLWDMTEQWIRQERP